MLRLQKKKKKNTHQLKKKKEKEKKRKDIATTIISYCKTKERRRKEALPFSLSTESPMIFYLLQVLLEGPKGDWGAKSKDPKEP